MDVVIIDEELVFGLLGIYQRNQYRHTISNTCIDHECGVYGNNKGKVLIHDIILLVHNLALYNYTLPQFL